MYNTQKEEEKNK